MELGVVSGGEWIDAGMLGIGHSDIDVTAEFELMCRIWLVLNAGDAGVEGVQSVGVFAHSEFAAKNGTTVAVEAEF